MSSVENVQDWTQGSEGIAYQTCPGCRATWYVRRGFCPTCGHQSPTTLQASGKGVVYATAVVTRAPTEALRAFAPYTIVLVDCEEGFRVMAHGEPGLKIGDAVTSGFIEFGGRVIPKFQARR